MGNKAPEEVNAQKGIPVKGNVKRGEGGKEGGNTAS